jgi:hypothetical protein
MGLKPFGPVDEKKQSKAAIANAKWWNSRFQAERINEDKEVAEARLRHPSAIKERN